MPAASSALPSNHKNGVIFCILFSLPLFAIHLSNMDFRQECREAFQTLRPAGFHAGKHRRGLR